MSNSLTILAPARLIPAATPDRASADPNRASATIWIAVFAAMIGAFMAILNIQITNASLLNIEGGIGTGVDNGSWISTSYLIGEIIVIPLTDYLSRVFSFRNIILSFATLFAAFSVACAFTHDLPSMIAMRGLQGFFGGVLIPMAFTLVFTKLPKGQQPIGLAMFSLAVTFAPAIGPTIGGYLTENYGWQTIFFVNVVPTAIMVTTLFFALERQPLQLGLLRDGDWFGIVTMAIGLASLQAVLEEGNKDDWFGSPFIVRLAVTAAISLSLFIYIELVVEKPLLRLRLLTQWNFGVGTIAAVFLGFALFGSVYLLPAYLGQVQGYNAEQIGNVLAWTCLLYTCAASGISNMMRNVGGAIGTAVLATIITKREQFHSNVIGQSVTLGREEVRGRIAQLTNYFMAHGVPDPNAAHEQAVIALGKLVKRQALVMGFSDTFAVIGVVLVLAAIAVLLTRQVKAAGGPAH
ncbi:DHA2 family efflux MFS transporter permease subunit [Bradyrhizobium sp. UFLA05-153]